MQPVLKFEQVESIAGSANTGGAFRGARKLVVHFTSVHPPFDFRIFHKECKSLARAGYRVTLIAACERDETVDDVHIRSVPRRANRVSRVIFTTGQVFAECLRAKADLYQFHDPELIPAALLLTML